MVKDKNIIDKIMTIPIFIIPFFLSSSDNEIGMAIYEYFVQFENWAFITLYFIYMYFFYKIAKFIIKTSPELIINVKDKKVFNKSINLFLLAYFLGVIINIGNEFIKIIFEKFIFNGVTYVF